MSEVKPAEEKKPVCFVLMPIADSSGYELGHFGRVYEHLLKPAITAAGYTPIRADDTVKTDYIVVGIIQKILDSAMVVCDFSSRNPNVMYELGIRHAFNKPVVLIKDRKTEKIFDIQGLRFTEYDDSLRVDSVNKDSAKITASIKETAENLDATNSIVHLAAIRAAELPAGQTISADTKLILAAMNGLDARMQEVEKTKFVQNGYFYVHDDSIEFTNGEVVGLGTELFRDGLSQGTLVAIDPKYKTILLLKDGRNKEIASNSYLAKGLNGIPF